MKKITLLAIIAALTLAQAAPALADHNERHAQKQAEAEPVYMEPGQMVDPMYADEGPAVVPETVPPTEAAPVEDSESKITATQNGETVTVEDGKVTTPASSTTKTTETASKVGESTTPTGTKATPSSSGATPSGPGGSASSKAKELPRTGGAPVVLIVAGASITLSGLYLLRRRTR